MNIATAVLLATLSIWDYPARQPYHEALRRDLIGVMRNGEVEDMKRIAEQGVKLLPDDATWRYNLACALAYDEDPGPALDALAKAVELGFRDAAAIAGDSDLAKLKTNPRFKEIVERAAATKDDALFFSPLYSVPADGKIGSRIVLGEQNLSWDFDSGAFVANIRLHEGAKGGNAGDLYMNRDLDHSRLSMTNWPGLTEVRLDSEGHKRHFDTDIPNMRFPYPLFGNASRAFTAAPMRRSIPRAMMTVESRSINAMQQFYLTNQIWVFPAAMDFPTPDFDTICSNDVFSSVAPYWITTQGRSWSDQYYLRAALEVSRQLNPEVKKAIVQKGMLAPVVYTLIRKSLKEVKGEEDYLTAKAHPTAFPPNGLDLNRLKRAAKEFKASEIPPLVPASLIVMPVETRSEVPEITYVSAFASALVLRSPDTNRLFRVQGKGADELAFKIVHDEVGAAKLRQLSPNTVEIAIDRTKLTTTNRVDFALFGRNLGTGWGAPSYISFAVVDPNAVYSDPALTPAPRPKDAPKPGADAAKAPSKDAAKDAAKAPQPTTDKGANTKTSANTKPAKAAGKAERKK